ncbi:MAG: class I SAM-dependent methyltransferase [Bacteroidota bacterium]|jgi:SAM-dependent methyltransferase
MPRKISRYLHHKHAPSILLRFPRLLFAYFWLNHSSVLRIQYSRRAIHRLLKKIPPPKQILDAGCGVGDFLFTIPEFRIAEKTTGIDTSLSNIELCNRLAETLRLTNIQFVCKDIAEADFPASQDLILCIGVLMYIQHDDALMKKFHNALSPEGRLIVYVPVNYRRRLSLYKLLSQRPNFDYDHIVGRMHTYTDESIEQLLTDAGFQIEERRYSYGPTVATTFEIIAILEWMIKTWHPGFAILILPFFVTFYPFYYITMQADYFSSRSTGNGVVITARKRSK